MTEESKELGLPLTQDTAVSPEKPKRVVKEKIKDPEISDLEVAKKLLTIHQSAVSRKIEFNLSFATVKKLMQFKTCYYTGKEFSEETGSSLARSFDRVENNKGYVEGNVVACTIDINQKKANLSNEEITLLYNKVVLKK